ncbi:DUF6412 domain-containing protein [Catellatospora citrea]|uniref:Uncharacterized protein n=1 Tax=Catellatospora citrea TaxID=53366 RepID=A0A8J3K9K0_9ACTN|nr:DUF6412 domain-containing protein [Catellatospora citrea]RKE10354.1 hypothetical protein C8E86_5249 [Catellatospora citrea]GIF99141.1 hypothetical protein Cci01nite_42350 [Catellatospora citrea]
MPIAAASNWALTLWVAVLCTGAAVDQPSLGGMLAGAAALLLVTALAVAAVHGFGRGPSGRAALDLALRELSRRTGVLRQRDPDAAGRPRPRAPGFTPLPC